MEIFFGESVQSYSSKTVQFSLALTENWGYRKKRLNRNRYYWIEKIEENIARDKRNDLLLLNLGWTPLHFWERQVIKQLDYCIAIIMNEIYK